MRTIIILFGLVLVAAAAGVFLLNPERNTPAAPAAEGTSQSGNPAAAVVPFTTLAEGSQSAVPARVNYLITTQQELTELWKLVKESSPVPKTDFTTKVVIAVFAGEAPTAGYAITVARVEDADTRIVKVELTKPDAGCVLAQSVTAPYQIIELPKTSLPLTHADTWTTKACP